MRRIEHWIDGVLTPGQSRRGAPVFDPATGATRAEVLLAEPADIAVAVDAAAKAAVVWRERSASVRARVMFAFRDLLHAHLDELAGIVSDEHGKVLADARGEVLRGIDVVEFACGIPHLLKGVHVADIPLVYW
jgi:malonate-semialdehyde dehydrogenase (acetylating)/methylmalonate-semialdehyde dehydrogenase